MGAQAALSENARAVMDTMTSDVRLVVAFVSLLAGLLTFTGGVGLLKHEVGENLFFRYYGKHCEMKLDF